MSFADWTRQQQKKKDEEKQQTRGGRQVDLYADDAQTQQGRSASQQTRTISVNAPTYSSRKPTFAEWTAHQQPDYVTNWIRDSQNLLNDTYQYSKSWSNDKTKYTNLKSRASGLLYSADWIKEMTSQDKDSSKYVGDIIDALSKAGTVRDDAQKYYSQFDTQDAYQMVQDYSTPEGRRKRYQNNKEKLALLQEELTEIQEGGGAGDERRNVPSRRWTGTDHANDLRKEIAAIQAEITNYERGNTGKLQGFHSNELQSLQQQLATLKAAYNQERKSRGASSNNFLGSDSSLPVFQADAATERESELAAQIQELEKKIANASGDSFYYGNKAADDAYFLTQNADFAENSKNRSFGNATKEQFDQYYYNAYGGEAINPKTGEVVATHRGLGYSDQSLDSLQINDPLGFWLDAEKSLESGALQYNSGGTQYREYDEILARADANDWDQLTDDEVSVYYYLMNTQGKKAASDFLDSMSRTLQRRQTEQDIKDATALYDEANVLGKIMLNLATVPVNAISNTVGFVEDAGRLLTGQDYNPYSKLKQGQVFTQAIRGATEQDLDATGFKIPVLDFSLGDIYQAGMSVLDSALLTGTLRIAGGIEAAEKAMYFMGMGAAESEARKLYEAGASDDQVAMGAAASGIAEALFEKASIENLVSIRSPESVFEMVKNIMVQGGVEASEEAFTEIANIITNSLIMDSQSEWAQSVMEHNGDTKAAFVDKVQQVAQAAFGGFLSGAASSTLHQGAAYADRQYQNYQVGHAIQQTEGGTDALMQLAQDVSESADKETAKKITRQGQKVVGYQKGTGITNDIRTGRLYDSTIRSITLNQANVIQKALIEAEVDPDYAKQITGAMRAQAYGLELTSAQAQALQKAGQNKAVQDVIRRVTSDTENAWTSRQNQARSLAEGVIIGDARGAQTAQQLYREAEQRVSDTGHAVMKDSGDEIDIKGVSSIQRGEMVLNIGGGKTVNANDIQYANADQAVLYQTVANMGGIVDAQTAQKIIDNFDASGNLSAQAYASGMRQAYMYGVYGYSASDVKNGAMSSELSGEQQVLAYTLGAQYGTVLRSHQPGLVIDDYVQQNIAPDVADKINKTARLLGVRVQFADSQAVGGGDANAQLQDGVILIEKGNPNPVMAILGHEWTHQIQDLAAREYETFKKSISSDPDVQAEASRLFDLYKRKGHPLTEDGAMDEAVANYAGRLINETDVLDKFLAENKQNKTLLQKMVDGIRKLIRKVTGAEKRQLQTVEGKLLAAMNAATDTADKVNINRSVNGNVQYSLKTVNGERVVWIENSSLSNKELNDHRAVANFIAQHIGEVYTIIESGQHVYIGKDLPSEYTQSKYTSYLRKTDRALVKAKNKAVDGLGELIETATNRRWEKTRHQDSKDAKYGMYRYDTTFAFPVMENGKMQRIRAYDAELLIRNASNGKKYLYDIVGIKENATAHISLSQREARLAAYQETATGGNVSNTSISTSPGNVKAKFSLKESVEETKDLIAVVPSNTSQVILDELRQRGVNTISYESGNSDDRLAKLNSVENAKFSIKGSERQADLVQLQNENNLLRQQVEYWKGQTKRTESVTTDKKSVLKAARSLVKGYSSTADVEEVAEQLQSLYDFIANNGDVNNELTYEDVRGRAESIAEDIVQNAVLADDDLRAQYADLRAYVRGTTLRVTDAIKDSIPDFNDWRKANFGTLRIANGASTNIDQVYQELSYQWPEFFNEEQTGNPADQLQQIADVMQTISQVTERNPFAYDMEAAVSGVANEILENFFDLPQTKATFADKQAFKLQEAKAAGKQRLQAQQAASKAKMQQLRQENRQRVRDAITAERMNAGKQISQLKNKYAAKTQAQKESRNAKELRAKITRHTTQLSKKLLSPTDNAHIPEQLRGPVATMLEAINQETGYSWGEGGKLIRSEEGNPTKRTQAFQELVNQYSQIMKDQNSFDGVLDPDIDEKLLDVVNLKDLRLNEMSTAQLRTVWEAVRAVEMSIQTAGKVLSEGKYQSTQEWANAFQQDANGRKTKGHITQSHLALDLENPYTFFSHFGDAGMRVYRMLRDAQDHQQRMVDQVAEDVQKIVDPKTVKKLETTRHTFKTERGDTLTLTTAQVMDLYNLMKRKQAQQHLEQGGVMQPEIKGRVGSKDRTIERGTDATLLSETDLTNIVGVLTKEETKIADDLQRLTVTMLAAFGNEASMTAYGYKKFTGSDYWPIRAATEQTKTDTENNSSGKQRSIKNIGMAKATTPGASNAVELRGVFDTFAQHASDMIDYSAWLVPMEDANHLFNYRFRETETGKTLKTIKGIIERTAGKGGQRYWQNLMDDIQNGMSSTGDSNLWQMFGKTVGSFKGAAVGGNIRVVIQQPTAWVRAAYVLNPVNMAKGLIKGVTDGNGWEKAKKYAGIAARKDNGSFDISSPYSLDETLFDKKSTLRKTSDALSWAAGQADAITWGRLWNACEWQVHQQNAALRPGSTEFYSEVSKTFSDMIDQTQVVDGVLQRSQAMRSSNEVMKQATSFMGEPLMSLNLMMRSYDAFRYTQDKGKRKTALRKMGRAASALVVTAAVNALAQSLVDAFRDDDDDKTYAQRYWSAFTGVTGEESGVLDWVNSLTLEGNFGGNLNVLTQIPFIKDYISLAQGYDVSRTEMEVVSDLIRAGQTFVKNIGGNGPKTQAYALKEVFAAGAKLFGLPVSNLTRDTWALARTIVNDSGNLPLQYQMEKAIYNLSSDKNKGRFLDLLYKALARGDMDTYQHIRSELSTKMGLDGATIDSALKTRYHNQRKKDPSYSLPDTTLAMIGIRKSVTLPTEEPSFSSKNLTDAQYQAYAQQKAEDYETLISHIEKNKAFQAMSDSAKDKVYRMAYNYTDQYALADNSDGTYEVSTDWMVKAKAASKKGTKVWDYLVDYVQNSEDNTAKNEAYANMYTALENGDIKEYQRIRNQVMRELELNGTDINSAMKSKYNAAKKANPSYKLDQKVLDLLGIVEKRGTAKSEEETFSAGNLSSSAYTSYETQRSTEYRQTATGVSGSSWFRGLDADDQDKVYAFAYQLAEEEALKDNSSGEYEISTKWIKEAANAQYYGLEDWQYTLFHSAYALATTDRDASGKAIKGQGKADKVRRWLNEQNLTEEQRAWLWSTVYSSEW